MNGAKRKDDRISGILLGTAVGDSLGLPLEGISRTRAEKMFPGPLRHRFIAKYGMLSDDTEHTFIVAQTLLEETNDPDLFGVKLARRLKFWFLSLPAGIGMATARACVKLLIGFSPKRSGVFSAGNGPAMRAAIFGAILGDEIKRREFLEVSTRTTHTDPKALIGAISVAEIVSLAVSRTPEAKPEFTDVLDMLARIGPDDEDWNRIIERMKESSETGLSVQEFADSLGLPKGVSGYVFHTVPVAVYAWHRHYGEFRETLESVIRCGGDTDTLGAITGAMAGATCGEDGIPREWIDGIRDCPINPKLLRKVSERLKENLENGKTSKPLRYFWPITVPRNLFFLFIVLIHGFRRLAPPY